MSGSMHSLSYLPFTRPAPPSPPRRTPCDAAYACLRLALALALGWALNLPTARAQTAAQSLTPPAPSEITNARALLELSPATAAASLPCRFEGVVTCSARREELLFVQDATAGVFVYFQGPFPKQGDRVEVRGTTGKGRFSPIVMADSVVTLGTSPLPTTLPIAIEELAFGRHDSQWIEVEGIVTRQSIHWGHILLQLTSGSARLDVRILEFNPSQTNQWVDARIKIRGVAGTAYNDRGQLVAFHLLTQNTQSLQVLRPAPPDPYAAPLRSSTSLMAYSPNGASEHRTRLQGVVSWAWPRHGFSLRDSSGEVRVLPIGDNVPLPGDLLEVVGFAAPTPNRPILQDAIYRTIGQTNPPAARTSNARDAATGSLDGELITLEAVVLKAAERHKDHTATILEADHKVFRVRHLESWGIPQPDHLVGTTVRVTGICTQDAIPPAASEGFSIWLRTAADYVIVQRSPLWRQRVTQWTLGGLGAAVALGAVLLGLLRHRVRIQTEAIRRRETALEERYLDLFENANDILYTLDLDGVLTSINHSGEAVFGKPASKLVGSNIESLMEPADIPFARQHLQTKISGAPRTAYELRFRDAHGQPLVLEINTRLLYKDGVPSGVQGIARDITERKEAEEALRSSERQLRASLEERERLGRDLHDDLIQSIYAAGLTLDDCTRILRPDPDTAERRLRSVTTELNRVIRNVRDFIGQLEQTPLSGDEFKTSLQSLALRLSLDGPHPVHVDIQIDDASARRLRSHQATHLLHIAREALSNSIRHGRAHQLIVRLQPSPGDGLHFEVSDDGSGFDPSDTERKGRGLRNIAARADRLGAWLRIHSSPGKGTRISLQVPDEASHESSPDNSSPDR